MNGQEVGEENFQVWRRWVESKTDQDLRALVGVGKLKRSEILRECGFARSVLSQNPRVRDGLEQLEKELAERGILAAPIAAAPAQDDQEVEPLRQSGQMDGPAGAVKLRDLEQRVQILEVDNKELRRRLQHYGELELHLGVTGRLAR